MIVDLDRRWLKDAICTGADLSIFFSDHSTETLSNPSPKVKALWDRAKRICLNCPVMMKCARDSLGEIDGVWGGLDPAQRIALRHQHGVNVRKLTGPLKEEYADLAYSLHKERSLPWSEVGRIMGLTVPVAQYLETWHVEHLKTKTDAAEEAKEAIGVPVEAVFGVLLPPVPFPDNPPSEGDAWIRHGRRVVAAHYLGQTEDDAWFRVKAKLLARENSSCWIKVEDIKIIKDVTRTVLHRVGNESRIYGTTLSASAGQRQKAG